AEIATDAIQAIGQWAWAGPLFWYAARDTGTDPGDVEQNFGLLRHDFSAKPALAAFTAATHEGAVAPPPPSPSPAAPPAEVPVTSTADVQSLAGSDRIATAIAVSGRHPGADTVVIASSAGFADAMVGGPLAARDDIPLLLTPPHQLDRRVRDEVVRLQATHAVLLGRSEE